MDKLKGTKNVVRKISLIGKYQHCYKIGDVSKKNLYKYMDFVAAIKALNNGLYIVEPSHWRDKYESRFYCAIYDNVDTTKYKPTKVYACCFSKKRTSEAAWKVYVDGKKGLAERCVQFTINRTKFRMQLEKYAKHNDISIYEGEIDYMLENEINGLHKRNNPNYSDIFSPFSKDSYLSLLLLKRPAFNYEEEVRYFFIDAKDNNKNPKGDTKSIKLSWKDFVSEVKVDSCCSKEEMQIMDACLKNAGINIKLTRFNLDKEKNEKPITIE